ncbi:MULTISPECIES: Y-family DNA polymerase [Sphingomonas]|uniref:Y-family DNA polymerase n=1 Tax=Sphingomonas TaxID=13687 RepID=UPI001F084B1F|nr:MULTISPECIES: DNA polymerase Y family protein [Sphingomonas]
MAIERWARTGPSTSLGTGPSTPLGTGPSTSLGTGDDQPERPVVLTVEAQHGQLIHAATDAALAGGARVGGRLTDARALDPALEAVPADVAGDAAWLRALALWAARWSPLVELDGTDALRLDLTGIAHLFGGEARLLAEMEARIAALGFTTRAAIAPTAGAAWALARFGGNTDQASTARLAVLLAPLPVAALRLSPQATHILVRLGLKTIGDLAGVPRKALARRFREAEHPLDALDRALGRKPEPLTGVRPDPPPCALLRMQEPVTHPEAGPQALALLVPRLVAELQTRKLGARALVLTGYRVDGTLSEASAATSIPTRDPRHLARLLADKAQTIDPGFGVDAFALTASWAERLDAGQDALVGEPSGETRLAELIDRLSVKLGPDKVRRPAPRESHLPERASGWVAGVAANTPARPERTPDLIRGKSKGVLPHERPSTAAYGLRSGRTSSAVDSPQRLLDTPEAIAVIYATPEGLPRRFVWRRKVHDIARAQGPQRIAPEWWRERSTARLRDYYKVEDEAGCRFWIFREGLVGDGRGGPPEWFVHGLFA